MTLDILGQGLLYVAHCPVLLRKKVLKVHIFRDIFSFQGHKSLFVVMRVLSFSPFCALGSVSSYFMAKKSYLD